MEKMRIGQVLRTLTNETVKIVSITNSSICVCYRGKNYQRSKDVIGVTLFVMLDVKNENDNRIVPRIELEQEKNNKLVTHNEAKKIYSCKNCMRYRREDCIGGDNTSKQFKYAPDFDQNEINNWPRYMQGPY